MKDAIATTAHSVEELLLSQLFDNANVFPPGSAPLESAVALHRAVSDGPYAWMSGRLLLPSSVLSELPGTLDIVWPHGTLSVGVVAETDLETVIVRCQRFSDPRVVFDQIEVRVIDSALSTYRELARLDSLSSLVLETSVLGRNNTDIAADVEAVAAIQMIDARVVGKVRCGGVAPGSVPSIAEVATFVVAAARANLPFKATAGLHHLFAMTNPDASTSWRHGFANILAATQCAQNGGDLNEVAAVLGEVNPDHLRAQLRSANLPLVRERGLLALGTCSITEPVADLLAAGWLRGQPKHPLSTDS
jgi:hemoglobin-like flavoprotein